MNKKRQHSMTVEYKASRSVLRTQRTKTYAAQLLWIPIAIGFLFSLLFYFLMFLKTKTMVKHSGEKLRLQKENFKPIKKERQMVHKKTKKELRKDAKVQAKTKIEINEIKLLNAPQSNIEAHTETEINKDS